MRSSLPSVAPPPGLISCTVNLSSSSGTLSSRSSLSTTGGNKTKSAEMEKKFLKVYASVTVSALHARVSHKARCYERTNQRP
ncbi:hypothetical protein BaRGS_00021945 [Batillaria attramentaria]|uniref:Uncharacterized protein n=1 Tax=Batillaria attramentaria TaxID=370345 RepID=A0ABD0KIH2_9CAEN